MFSAAYWSAVDFVNKRTAPFDELYAAVITAPTRPATEEILIIEPPPASRINGITDLGYAQQVNLFKKIKTITGKTPIVFDAKDILNNPEKYLKKMCEYFNISFSSKMLKWSRGERKTDGVWSPYWYKNVINSNSFSPARAKNNSK